ncbi:hypothetical protein [Aeromonas rivipollensis]|uniref:Uncharacterized protein n=1 Tax=Aeromonas rivipollensis TaxID=948519 RepID=A0AAW9YCL9_9GAMM|nr:hypothetical protein [Aeromonas rivipollensis]NEX75357.1 hypothetical protein [Aeromonas rivipollensis]
MHYNIIRYPKNIDLEYRIESHDSDVISSDELSGWLVINPHLDIPWLELTLSDGLVKKMFLDKNRPDVTHYFKDTPRLNEWKAYEFRVRLDSSIDKVDLVTCNGLIFSLMHLNETKHHLNILEKWSRYLHEGSSNLINFSNNIKNIDEPYISIGEQAVKNSIYLNDEKKEGLINLLSYLESSDFIVDFVEKKMDLSLKCDHLFSSSSFINSFYIKNINIICVKTEHNDPIYILQHFSSFDGMYYPKYNIFYAKTCMSPAREILIGLIDSIATNRNFIHKIGKTCEPIFLCGHSRPYHFLYDNLLGYAIINKYIPSVSLNITSNGSGIFFPLSKIKSLNLNEFIVDSVLFNSIANGESLCFIIGMKYAYSNKDESIPLLREIDDCLIESIDDAVCHDIHSMIGDNSPVFWFGITSQKRQWINQVDCIVATIDFILKIYPDAVFIIDGWTSPIIKSSGDYKQIKSDMDIYREIKNRCDNGLLITTIGMNSLEKISIGLKVDFFVSNSSTGTVHIDRICNRKGISHGPNKWSNTDCGHISNAIKISNSFIKDLNSEKSADEVDYFIDKDGFISFLNDYFNRRYLN